MNLTLLTLLVLLAATEPRVSIRVSPQTLFAGQSIAIVCTVPHNLNNRKLTAVVDGYTVSERQLDGELAPKTFRFEFKKIPCEIDRVACVLTDVYGGQQAAIAPIQVAGCEP